jgi:hypothetical protein
MMTDHFTLTGDTAMPNVTTQSLNRDRFKVSSDKAIAWREDLAERMEIHDIPYLSTATIKILSKTGQTPIAVTAYYLPNGTLFVWRDKSRLMSTTGMRNRYWNWTAKLPFTGADYYPFADKSEAAA